MVVIIAIDALEYNLVEEFQIDELKQLKFGKTDISEFSDARTMVLWSSFMTGQNKEEEILAKGDTEMWNTRIPLDQTFFSKFNKPIIIDLPGYNYDLEQHEESRKLLKEFFEDKSEEEKQEIRKKYNKQAIDHEKNTKTKFLEALESDADFVLGYFSAIDVIGHLNFGNKFMMKTLYKQMVDILNKTKELRPNEKIIILSDHGMQGLGQFGDHSNYGFWSTNFDCDLNNPKITEFRKFIFDLKGDLK